MDLWQSFLKFWEPPTAIDGSLAEILGARVVVGLIFVVAMFTIAPMTVGNVMHKVVRKKSDLFLSGSIGVMIYVVVSTGLGYVLRQLIPVEQISDLAIGVMSFAVGVALGVLVARFLLWWLRDPDMPQWAQEYRALPDEELMPFERRKRQWQERKTNPRKPS
jgi:hypothetical protein